jgi:tRNA-specific 2-thiouridylase
MKNRNQKVVVGISGGVDSAVSAYLLKKQGYDILGVYMWCYGSHDEHCRAHQDRADAVKIASQLNIPFQVWDFEKQYSQKVLKYFYNEYQNGRTPNPDVVCNKEIKFGLFYDRAIKELGYDFVATGHYARVSKGVRGKGKGLSSGKDKTKDQSYFLYRIKLEQLSHILFPVGELTKKEVRKIAKEAKLLVYNKPDSQGVCFVGEISMRDFLKGKVDYKDGIVVDTKGEVIGSHTGLPFYTIGQRRGFNLTKYKGLPMYVIGKNANENKLIVGCGKETEVESFVVSDINWLVRDDPISFIHKQLNSNDLIFEKGLKVRIRHLGKLIPCNLQIGKFKNSLGTGNCELSISQRGVASGQSAVFYLDDIVICGGVIS